MVEKAWLFLLWKRGEEGEELKAPRYARAMATRDYIITRDIIPNSLWLLSRWKQVDVCKVSQGCPVTLSTVYFVAYKY